MKTVCGVVVTYNRKAILRECLSAIQHGTLLPDTILVVDNGSTDGTAEMVRSEFPTVQLLTLAENAGGAGGFHAGMKWAHASGFDFLWVMDDDGIAGRDCLEVLLGVSIAEQATIISPIVIDVNDGSRLSFGLMQGLRVIETLSGAKENFGEGSFIAGQGSPFNGTLYGREVIDRIGLPDHRLFIRGDEIEYQRRYKKAGLRHGTTLAATQRHPADLADKYPLVRNRFTVNFTGNKLKDYCIFRNKAVIYRKYGCWGKLFFELPKHFYFFLIKRRFDVSGLSFWTRAYAAGIAGRFGGERQYLNPITATKTPSELGHNGNLLK